MDGCIIQHVAVSLRNDAAETYRHDVYGDVITIERKINNNSGGAPFTVRDAQGNKVAAGRGEIDAVLEHFSVDVSNPVTVMTQDLSRSFLHSGKDEDKYKFFMQVMSGPSPEWPFGTPRAVRV